MPLPVLKRQTGCTVLVVDDEPAVRRLMAAVLRRHGYGVLEASGRKAALEQFLSDPAKVDLVICDVMLSGESGVDVVRTMLEHRPGLRVVFVSGYVPEDLKQHEMALRGHAILGKPFSIEELLRSVDQACGASDASA